MLNESRCPAVQTKAFAREKCLARFFPRTLVPNSSRSSDGTSKRPPWPSPHDAGTAAASEGSGHNALPFQVAPSCGVRARVRRKEARAQTHNTHARASIFPAGKRPHNRPRDRKRQHEVLGKRINAHARMRLTPARPLERCSSLWSLSPPHARTWRRGTSGSWQPTAACKLAKNHPAPFASGPKPPCAKKQRLESTTTAHRLART